MADQVEEVKQKTDIVSLIGEYVQLKKAGRNYKALCPFHSERTPSFMVSPELQMYKCFGCFPAGQFVKTPFGYHKIEDVVRGEYVISGRGIARKVILTHKRGYKGGLVSLKLSQLTEPVKLTKDHKVFIIGGASLYTNSYKYLSKRLNAYAKYSRAKRLKKIWRYFPIKTMNAGELQKGMSLLYPVDKGVSDVVSLDLSDYITKKWPPHGKKPLIPELEVEVNKKFLKLVGYYIAEGSNHRAYLRFSLGNKEGRFAKEIVSLIEDIFRIEASVHNRSKEKRTGLEVTACNSILANVFENLCGKGAENKHIPFVFQQLPKEKQLVLLEAIFRGDGYGRVGKKAKTLRREITTVSRVLSEQLVDILLRLGFFPSRYVGKEKRDKKGVHHKETFTVSWSSIPKVSKFHHLYETKEGSMYWILPILQITKKKYVGKVYNLTVEGDHSYVVNNFSVANCGEAGDAFTFLQRYEGMEFGEALRFLADRAGVKLTSFRPGEAGEKERLYQINSWTSRFYSYILLNHPIAKPALAYLTKERGISLDSINTFQLGFAPNVPDVLKRFLVDKKGVYPKDLERLGLGFFKNGKFFDKFAGRIIFPLFDHRGNVAGFAGRVMPTAKEDTAKYINSPETPIYHKSNLLFGLNLSRPEIKKEGVAVVVEGELDMISSWQVGVKNVVAIKGTALTDEQVRLLSRFSKNATLALDADLAGDAAARRGISVAELSGMDLKVARFGQYKDPDEAARANPAEFKKSLAGAVGVWDYLVDSIFSRYDSKSGEGKTHISREIVPILTSIPDKIVQAHYIEVVATKLGVPSEAVTEQVEEVSEKAEKEKESLEVVSAEKVEKGRRQLLEERLLTLAFQSDPKILLGEETASLIITPLTKRILEEYQKFARANLKFSPSEFAEGLPKELLEGFAEMALRDLEDLTQDAKVLEKELKLVKRDLKILELRRKIEVTGAKIRKFEEGGEVGKLKKAQEKFGALTNTLSELEEEAQGGIILQEA